MLSAILIIKYFNPAGFESTHDRNRSKSWYSFSSSYEASGISKFKISIYWPLVLVCVLNTTGLQKIALAWMFQKETRSLHCSGGILADDQVTFDYIS